MTPNDAAIRSNGGMRRRKRASDSARPALAGDPARRRLTAQERDVALLIGEGLKDYAIARRLSIAPKTVATYVRRIRSRLNLASRQELVAWVTARRDPAHPEAGLARTDESHSV